MTDAELEEAIFSASAAAWERGEWVDDALTALEEERYRRYKAGAWTGQTCGQIVRGAVLP